MSSTEITVRGSFAAFRPPERATVHAFIAYEGPQMEPVYERVGRDLDALKASITSLDSPDHGPVTVVVRPATAHLVEPAVEQGWQTTPAHATRASAWR